MIRYLPEGSNYAAKIASAPVDPDAVVPDEAPEPDPVQDAKEWTLDRRLTAQLINAVHTLIRHSVNWQEGHAPEYEIVGPAVWREASTKPSKRLSVMDVISRVTGQHG